jgi:hypothetical protein
VLVREISVRISFINVPIDNGISYFLDRNGYGFQLMANGHPSMNKISMDGKPSVKNYANTDGQRSLKNFTSIDRYYSPSIVTSNV